MSECEAYFERIGGTRADAEAYADHFISNGWKVSGKAPMKCWQAAARQWMRRATEYQGGTVRALSHRPAPVEPDVPRNDEAAAAGVERMRMALRGA
jgi:hypothetical protein